MSPEDEAAWRIVVENPLIRSKKLAAQASIPLSKAREMLAKIGTPRHVLVQAQKARFTSKRP